MNNSLNASASPLHIPVSYYHSYFDNGEKEPKQVFLDEFLFSQEHIISPTKEAIRTAEFVMSKTNSLLKNWRVKDFMSLPLSRKLQIIRSTEDKVEKDKLKKLLPAVTPSALFHGRRHKNSTEYTHTGFLVLDIDGVDVEDVKTKISQSDKIIYCGLSVSGRGLFVIIQIAHPDKHLKHFASAKQSFEDDLKIRIDQLPDTTRLRGYAFDSTAFYNPIAKIYEGLVEIDENDSIDFTGLPELEPTAEFDKPEYCEEIIKRWDNKGYNIQNDVYTTIQRCVDLAKKYGLSDEYIYNYFYRHYLSSGKVQSDTRKYSLVYYENAFKDGLKYRSTHNKLRFRGTRSRENKSVDENQIRVNKYVSEIINLPNTGYLTATQVKILLEAPTGGGKTTFSVELSSVWHKIDNSITVIAVPTNAIAEQQARKYKCPFFTSESFDEALEQLNAERERTAYVFANYDNAVKVIEMLKSAGRIPNLIIDEQHELINGYNYRSRVVSNLYKSTKDVNRVILMSATPFLEGFGDYRHLKVITTEKQDRTVKVLKSKRAIINATLAEIKSHPSKAIVLLNDKKRIEQLHQALLAKGIRSATIKNDGERNNETYNYLMQHETLPSDVDILICTSKIATGVNIYAKEKTRMIYAEVVVIDNKPVFNKRLCQQFFARIRNTEMAEYIAITLNRNDEIEKRPINSAQFYHAAITNYEKRASELSLLPEFPTEVIKNDFSEYIEMYMREDDGTIIVNELAIMYLVMSKEIRNGDVDELTKKNELFESIADEDKQALSQAAAEFRQVQVKTEQEIYNLFTTERQKLAGSIYRKTKDRKLKDFLTNEYNAKYWQHHTNVILSTPQLIEAAEQAFNRDRRTAGLKVKEDDRHKLIFDSAKEMLTTNTTFGRTCNALSIHLALEGFYTSEVDKRQVKQYKAIRKTLLLAFEKQGYLSSEEIQKLVNKHFTVFKTKTKTTQIAEIFFELERKTIGEEKVYFNKKSLNLESIAGFYNIDSRHFCSIYNKRKKTKTGGILPEETAVLSEVDCYVNPAILNPSNEPCPF